MMDNATLKSLENRMNKAVSALKEELATLRTGRASTSILEHLMVDAYGSKMPVNQLATLNVPEARLITIQPWDRKVVSAIEKAIRESDLGLNPLSDGIMLRVPLPELTEERRRELVKLVHKYGEQAKIGVRNVRRDGMDQIRKAEKSKEISQDEMHQVEKQIQDLTDAYVAKVDAVMAGKEEDIMQV